jgi:nitroreductase
MELDEALRRRRMVRSFAERPVDPALLGSIFSGALGAPSAGNTQGASWLVLRTRPDVERYWAAATTAEWRGRAQRWPGLARAPVVALALTEPAAYVTRYGEADKEGAGLGPAPLGGDVAAWPVPYWFTDAAFGTMAVLLKVTAAGLGACFLGNFRAERAVLAAFGVEDRWRLFGTVVLGYPDGLDHRSSSLDRPPVPAAERIRYDRWT